MITGQEQVELDCVVPCGNDSFARPSHYRYRIQLGSKLPKLAKLGLFLVAMFLSATTSFAQVWAPGTLLEVDGREAAITAQRDRSTDRRIARSPLKLREASFPWHTTRLPNPALETARMPPPKPGAPTQIGFSRDIGEHGGVRDLSRDLQWLPMDGEGTVTALSFESAGAAAVRLGLVVTKPLPDEVEFRFFRPGQESALLVSGAAINATIERNRAVDGGTAGAELFWSPVIGGEAISLEIYVPRGTDASDLGVYAQSISHLLISPADAEPSDFETRIGESGSCNLDVTCYPDWDDLSRAVARMVFTRTDGSFLCSGTLLNDIPGSFIPHFLTANHCIASQTVASTLNTFWFYQTESCDSGALGPDSVTLFGGADLLHAEPTTDTTLLRLSDPPPAGAYYSGWSIAWPYLAQPSAGIHHPRGDLKKISLGSVRAFRDCDPSDSGSSTFSCWSGTQEASNFIDVQFTAGTTEGGSSGSGVFDQSDQQLIGVLYGGSSSCAAPDGRNIYGRFDRSYVIGDLGRWLNPDESTFALSVSTDGPGQGTVTSIPAAIDCGAICSASFLQDQAVELYATADDGFEFLGWSGDCTGIGTCSLVMDAAKTVSASFGAAVTTVNRGDPVTGLSGPAGSSRYFSVEIPAGATNLFISTSGGTGDADLFVDFGSLPTLSSYSCSSLGLSTVESCQYATPEPGTYYIQIYGFTSYADVQLLVDYDMPPACVYEDTVIFPATTVTTEVTVGACRELTLAAGTLIEPTGSLSIEAGSYVGIQPGGLRLRVGGRLRVAIESALAQ